MAVGNVGGKVLWAAREGAATVWKGPPGSGKESRMGIFPPTKEMD